MNENYLGNPNLFKAHTKQEYTKQQIVEIDKCMNDPVYFIKTYIKIPIPGGKPGSGARIWDSRPGPGRKI